jgi:type IV pilus assembly protein PilM
LDGFWLVLEAWKWLPKFPVRNLCRLEFSAGANSRFLIFMALANQTILALGASHLSVTILSGSAESPVLEQVVHQAINGNPDQKEQWLQSIDVGLEQLSLKTSLKAVTGLVLPGWVVLTKLLKVTRIDGDGQREVVRFEAENALPNGLTDYEWTFSVLQDDGFERDVLLQAVSAGLLNRLLDTLKSHGVQPHQVDALISAQSTAFQKQYGSDEGASVLLDIGSRSVSLVVSSQNELPFIRNFNFGGSLVTQSIASQIGKSFFDAEQLKLEWTHAEGDRSKQETLNQSSEGFVNRLVNEVQRSLALYRRQGQGQSGHPSRILLTGGASQLPGLADFLERKTGIPTAFYDTFRGVSSGPGLAASHASRFNYVLSGPLGLAMRLVDNSVAGANLLPKQLSSRLEFSERKPWLFAAAALVLLSGMLVGLNFHMQSWELQSEIALLDAELAPLESLSQNVKAAHEDYTKRGAAAKAKVSLLQQRQYWVALLADLQRRLHQVQDVWLESISPEGSDSENSGNRLRVTGSLLDRENPLSQVSGNSRSRVESLLSSFENSPFIQSIENRRFDTSQPGILQFDFSLVVNPDTVF